MRVLRELADLRRLPAARVAKVSEAGAWLLDQWVDDGWLHPEV